jgi:hypothetical protein
MQLTFHSGSDRRAGGLYHDPVFGWNIKLTGDGSRDIAVNWSDERGSFQLQDGGDFEQEADTHLLFHSIGGDVYGGIVYDDAIVVTFDFCHNGQAETDFVFAR